jgi:hypothetical protein
MTVLLRHGSDLPPPGTYQQWLAIGAAPDGLEMAKRLSDLPRRLEEAFDDSAGIWLALGRALGLEPTAGLAHTPACAANVSDFGLMLAWSAIVAETAANEACTLVVCDNPWLFRHLAAIDSLTAGAPPTLWPKALKLAVRGVAARLACTARLTAHWLTLQRHRRLAPQDARVLLVYGHPRSMADGDDGYFGRLMNDLPGLSRVLHVDCPADRARALEGGGRTLSLHAWGRMRDLFCLPWARWRPAPEHLNGPWGWLVRHAVALEGGTAQGTMIAWQRRCQRRWLRDTRPQIVVWPWENHSWERDFVRAAREVGTRTIGYQHSVVGPQMLNYGPGSNPDGLESVPDRILCTGPATRRQLAEWGVPEQRLGVGGALRIPDVPPICPDAKGPVFLALPFDAETARQMVAAARALTGRGYRFLVKDHPMTPFQFTSTDDLQRTDKPFFEHSGLKALVFSATTVGLEAALAGLPTIRFRPEGRIALNILPTEVDLLVADAAGLEAALDKAPPPVLDRDNFFSFVSKELWQKVLDND